VKLRIDFNTDYSFSIAGLKKDRDFIPRLEAVGFDGLCVPETPNDPFPTLSIAAYESSTVALRSGIAVAFSRNPMTMAYAAHELNVLAEGRFTLGLGTQIKPHIVRRFSMPWHGAARQMEDYLLALRAIHRCWYEGETLDYAGKYYNFNLMPPDFRPSDVQFGAPKVVLAAVGPQMIKLAARHADGIVVHTFSTQSYLHDYVIPLIERERLESGRTGEFEISFSPFLVCTDDQQVMDRELDGVRQKIAFYGSTPAYKRVLDFHDLGGLHDELHKLSRAGRWDEMSKLIDDDVMTLFACIGNEGEMPRLVKRRFKNKVNHTSLSGTHIDDAMTARLHQIKNALSPQK
jgi:probable F420-dependent oxidoreductase